MSIDQGDYISYIFLDYVQENLKREKKKTSKWKHQKKILLYQ